MVDAGYDVSDHRTIDPLFGSLTDAERLIDEAHANGLRVLVDIVPNHTSDRHPWFQAALGAPPGSPERRRYIFRDGRGVDGVEPPNDWRSVFGGPAWTRAPSADGQWYLHLFAPQQPDLDWTDPRVRDEMIDILTVWLERGVDGFRIDVAHGMAKAPGLPDIGYANLGELPFGFAEAHDVADHPHWDREEVHEIHRAWRRLGDRFPGVTFVGEVVLRDIARTARYVRADELHSVFNFPFIRAPWNARDLRAVIDATIREFGAVDATCTWVLGNHDVHRVATRHGQGDDERGRRRSMAAHLLMLALPGGAYIYQGDELGLPEVVDIEPADRRDPIFVRSGGADRGRDGCRVPLPWSGDHPPFGFSPPDAKADPWLPQPAEWAGRTVERQRSEPHSPLATITATLALRRTHPALRDDSFRWEEGSGPDVIRFSRGTELHVLGNLGTTPVALPDGARVLICSTPCAGPVVPPDATCWYELRSPLRRPTG